MPGLVIRIPVAARGVAVMIVLAILARPSDAVFPIVRPIAMRAAIPQPAVIPALMLIPAIMVAVVVMGMRIAVILHHLMMVAVMRRVAVVPVMTMGGPIAASGRRHAGIGPRIGAHDDRFGRIGPRIADRGTATAAS